MWIYKQSTGLLNDPDGKHIATGYAGGNCGKNPEGINNSAMQDKHSIGPLPQGLYTFGTPLLQSHLGPFAIPLIPNPSNEMYGRSAFYCHGDKSDPPRSASEGCIIMPRAIRNSMWQSDDHQLQVIA